MRTSAHTGVAISWIFRLPNWYVPQVQSTCGTPRTAFPTGISVGSPGVRSAPMFRVGATLAVVPVRTTKRRTKLKFPRSCPPHLCGGQDRGFFDSLDNFPGGCYFPRYRVGRMIAVSSVSSSPFQAAMKRISAFLIRYPRLPRSASCCWHFWESLTARLLSQSR